LNKSAKEHMANDIENRLDDFFGEDSDTPDGAKPDVSIEKLKSVVLSIDWEITESCLTDLITETDELLPHYEDDRLPHTLLRMLRAVGRYMRLHKVKSHPDAIKLIMSVFNSIEQITGNPQLSEDQKRALVAKEIAAFKRLKRQVEKQLGARAVTQTETAGGKDAANYVQNHELTQAVNTVEQRLNSEVAALRQQLAHLQKELNDLRIR
jgi:hypothetical protein